MFLANKKLILHSFLVPFFLLSLSIPLEAVPPAPGVEAPGGNTCFVNEKEFKSRAAVFGSPAAVIGQPDTSNATPNVLVLRVSFSDLPMTLSFASTESFFEKVRDFYIENSYGVFRPTFTVSNNGAGSKGDYSLGSNLATYGADCLGGDVGCNSQLLLNDAKAAAIAADATTDFAQFSHLMIYHAGDGQESSGVANDIWSLYFPTDQTFTGSTTKVFPGFTIVPETEAGAVDPLGVICHEYGHQLGLPDLYDTSVAGGQSTVGAWDVMDYPFTNKVGEFFGANPPHFGAWAKVFLGFASLQSDLSSVTLNDAETSSNSFLKIDIPSNANEYFLVEYRNKDAAGATYDKGIAMSGVLVWHIDENVALDSTILANNNVNNASQNGANHRGVDVVEADGSEPNPNSADLGAGDAFVDGQSFSAPQSNSFAGVESGITIANISGVGGSSLSFNITSLEQAAALALLKIINYPNPGGDPAKYPVRAGAPAGTVTTFVLQLTKSVPAKKMELDIYNLKGDRVRSVSGSDLQLRLGAGEPSRDFKWVYEYDWNGENDSGEAMASGVYIYRFKADDKIETEKMVLVR